MVFKSPTAPMAHQLEAVRRALRKPNAFAYMGETGTGKSGMALIEWQHRYNLNDIRDLLIIAPAGSIKNWYRDKTEEQLAELKNFLDPKLYQQLLFADNSKKAESKYARIRLLKSNGSAPRALFVNIEALSQGKNSHTELLCREFLKEGHAMMVIDESTRIRHHDSARSKAVLRLGQHAKARRIMTGMIVPRSPLDLFAQMKFLDWNILGYTSYVAFRARYAKMHLMNAPPEAIINHFLKVFLQRKRLSLDTSKWDLQQKIDWMLSMGAWPGGGQPIPIRYQNLDELREKYLPYCFQVWKKDCLDLKPKIYEFRDVELTDEQKRIYKEIRAQAMAELKDGRYVTPANILSQMVRLHQIVCGHVRADDGAVVDIESNRIAAIKDIVEEHDGKAIIWCIYDEEIRKIIQALSLEYGPESVAGYWGGNRKTRDTEERRFLGDPSCKYMVSSQPTGGVGNTWNVATLSIYACNSHDLEHRFQSEDRNHRKGQQESVTYIDLITRGTVEEKIIIALRKKLDLAMTVTGANYKDWLI
jgi:Mesyanzhinovviridae DNA helicase